MKVPATRRLTVTERSSDLEDPRTRRTLESSRPGGSRLASTQITMRAKRTIFPTFLTLESTKLLFCCLSTRKERCRQEDKSQNFGLQHSDGGRQKWKDRVFHGGDPRSQGHDVGRHRLILLHHTAQYCGGRKKAWLPFQGRGVAKVHRAEHGYQGRKRRKEVQCDGDAHVGGDDHRSVGALVHAWSATDVMLR
jgi:hypothetical protein